MRTEATLVIIRHLAPEVGVTMMWTHWMSDFKLRVSKMGFILMARRWGWNASRMWVYRALVWTSLMSKRWNVNRIHWITVLYHNRWHNKMLWEVPLGRHSPGAIWRIRSILNLARKWAWVRIWARTKARVRSLLRLWTVVMDLLFKGCGDLRPGVELILSPFTLVCFSLMLNATLHGFVFRLLWEKFKRAFLIRAILMRAAFEGISVADKRWTLR